jgi:hypothetical protein
VLPYDNAPSGVCMLMEEEEEKHNKKNNNKPKITNYFICTVAVEKGLSTSLSCNAEMDRYKRNISKTNGGVESK